MHLGPRRSSLHSGQRSHAYVYRLTQVVQSQCSGHFEPRWEECCVDFFFFKQMSSAVLLFSFLLPFLYPPFFTVITMWQVPGCPCVRAYGWIVGIASHASVLLSRGWLITMEAPGHAGLTPSTQLDAQFYLWGLVIIKGYKLWTVSDMLVVIREAKKWLSVIHNNSQS